jgi:hypothetical protein
MSKNNKKNLQLIMEKNLDILFPMVRKSCLKPNKYNFTIKNDTKLLEQIINSHFYTLIF